MTSLEEIRNCLAGRLIGNNAEFDGVSTDTRSLLPGELFVALKGENFNGNLFVKDAMEKGAAAAIVDEEMDFPVPVLLVRDAKKALGQLAHFWRKKFQIPVVAITGSNGKTTVKEMTASILKEAAGGNVLYTQGNLNNEIGVPLTLLKLRKNHRFAVIEMGMNHPGEISYLSKIASPTAALINNAACAHLQGLGSVEEVARAKGEIFDGLAEEGTAVLNADDAYFPLWKKLAGKHKVISFSLENADCRLHEYGSEISVEGRKIRLSVPGIHNARNALAAATCAGAIGISSDSIIRGLEKFSGVKGRMQMKKGKKGSTLIDDTYNANPESMSAAISWLGNIKGVRIFVMGDMGELGEEARSLHETIGMEAKKSGIEKLFALGELSRSTCEKFGEGARHCQSLEELLPRLDENLSENTTVLVKGSRFMKMERVVNALEEAPCS